MNRHENKLLEQLVSPEKRSIISGPFGSNISKKFFKKGGVPVIRGNNLSLGNKRFSEDGFVFLSEDKADDLNTYAIPDDIIFTAAGTIGQVGIIPLDGNYKKYVISNKQLRVRFDKTKILPLYAYYWLSSPWIQSTIKKRNVGSTVPLINLSIIRRLPIKTPSIKVQSSIVFLLSTLDAKIDLNNRINAELESLARTIYDYWFLQFDFPDEEGRPYRSSGGEMRFDEELGREVPVGWKAGTFGSLIADYKGGDWGKEEQTGNYVKHVTCLRGTDLDGLSGTAQLNPPGRFILEKNEHKVLSEHDLIVEISGGSPTQSTGRLGYISDNVLTRFDKPLICSNFCKALTLEDSSYFYYFIMHWTKLYEQGAFFNFEGKTSGIKNLLFDAAMSTILIALPTREIATKFYDLMSEFDKKKQLNLRENFELENLRDWLLPLLMSGEVVVGE